MKFIDSIIQKLPSVEEPAQPPSFPEKMKWTGIALLVFAFMGILYPVGVTPESIKGTQIHIANIIFALRIGTLNTLGIEPIVMASIILQLLVGGGFLKLDLMNPEDRAKFQGYQKFLTIVFCFFLGFAFAFGMIPVEGNSLVLKLLVGIQLAFAGIIIMFLDEIVSKYGIGSGVGLFIAAGVSSRIFWRVFAPVTDPETGNIIGLLWQFIISLINGAPSEWAFFPMFFTVLVFLLVVYMELMKLEIPLVFGRVKGFGTRFPIKFLYVSNIPVIFAAALLASVETWGLMFQSAGFPILGQYGPDNRPINGIAYFLQTPRGYLGSPQAVMSTLTNPISLLHIAIYSAVFLILCVLFGKFWVEIAGLGPSEVAKQLQNVGLQIPGFRRDPRVLEKVLARYIPTITILGSIAVGLLAVFADLTGAIGTGTGILLTVGILYRFYEQLEAEGVFETYPVLKKIFGG